MIPIKYHLDNVFEVNGEAFSSLEKLLALPFEESGEVFEFSDCVCRKFCGNGILLRGIVEFSSFCKNNCYYCGLNAGNKKLHRYRLTEKEILDAVKKVSETGIKTVVLQSGEDENFDWDKLSFVISEIKRSFDMQITLSCGEQEAKLYEKWKKAGADRYLLKIETSNKELYQKLHPGQSFDNRLECLRVLKKLGYQAGSGVIIGLKGQTLKDIANDIIFFSKEEFDMIGINPFIAHSESMLKDNSNGDPYLTIKAVALTRIITKNTHLPATTALGSIRKDKDLRILALKSGANVIMPNFTPYEHRKEYEIYPDKRCLSEGENIMDYLRSMAAEAGKVLDFSRGDTLKAMVNG
ncbi:MAG: [FeFe] hydrogenase H-cluster radical SAM maturase HydE [Endomicrobia bacterium]|nr:[FeFe] hydrogenase H-cluster radical SAM maturase HydE [Endomicrobiia bacterium]